MKRFCTSCGISTPQDWKFCAKCGSSLEELLELSLEELLELESSPSKSSEKVRLPVSKKKLISEKKLETKKEVSPTQNYNGEALNQLQQIFILFLLDDDGNKIQITNESDDYEEHLEIIDLVAVDDHEEFDAMCQAAQKLNIKIDDFVAYYSYRRAKYVMAKRPGFWSSIFKENEIEDLIDFKSIVEMFEEDEKLFLAFKRKIKPLEKLFPLWRA